MKPAFSVKIILSFFILAMGGFAFYEYRNSSLQKQEKEKSRQLLPNFKIEDLKAIRLLQDSAKNQKPEQLSLVKKGEDWFLLEPVKDLASFTELSRWFNTISRHKVTALELESSKDFDYHLSDSPTLELELKSGETLQLSVSSKSSFDGRWFIKKGDQIFLAEQGIDKELKSKNLADFRSKKILSSLNHAAQIDFLFKNNPNKTSFTLYWKDYKWSLEGRRESELPLDQSFLNQFWTKLSGLEANAILDSNGLDFKSQLKKYKLDNKALLSLKLYYGEKEYVLKLSPSELKPDQEDKLYASISHRDYIFEIPKEKKEELFLSKKDIYDHNFPFDFEIPLVSQIQIQNQSTKLSLKKKKDKWSFVKDSKLKSSTLKQEDSDSLTAEELLKPKSSQEIQTEPDSKEKPDKKLKEAQNKKTKIQAEPDAEKIKDFLNQLKSLKGLEYKKAKQLKEAASLKSIQLENSKGGLLFELKELEHSKKQSWVKSSLWDEWIALPKEEADKIFNLLVTPAN